MMCVSGCVSECVSGDSGGSAIVYHSITFTDCTLLARIYLMCVCVCVCVYE